MGYPTSDGLPDSRLEIGSTIAIEQTQQSGGDGARVVATRSGLDEQRAAVGGSLGEAIGAAMLAGLAFACCQLRDVLGVFHLLALVVAARMRSDDRGSVQDLTSVGLATTVSVRCTYVWGML